MESPQDVDYFSRFQVAIDGCGTPAYVYSERSLRRTATTIREAYADVAVDLFFFYSANKNESVLRVLRDEGFGVVAVRPTAVPRLLDLGYTADEIEFSGFGLSTSDMKNLLDAGININLSSEPEIFRFAREYPGQAAGVRVCLFGDPTDKRGLTVDQVGPVLRKSRLRVSGLHTYIGSNISDVRKHAATLDNLSALISAIPESSRGQRLYLNVGGGFGYDYSCGREFGWQAHSDAVGAMLDVLEEKHPEFELSLRMEIGRSAVVNSGWLVARVLHAYQKAGVRFIAVDTTISHFPRPVRYGFSTHHLPHSEDGLHRIRVLGVEQGDEKVAVVGNSHYSKDWLGFAYVGQFDADALEGSLVIFMDAGAYTEAMADTWSDEPRPASVMLRNNGDAEIVTRRGEMAEAPVDKAAS